MASVNLPCRNYQFRGQMPDVCIYCGKPATGNTEHYYQCSNVGWGGHLLAMVFGAIIFGDQVGIHLPVSTCDRHRKQSWLAWLPVAILGAVFAGGILFITYFILQIHDARTMDKYFFLSLVTWASLLAISFLGMILTPFFIVRASQITPDHVRMVNVSHSFVEAYDALQSEPEEEVEIVEEIDVRRPRRKTTRKKLLDDD